MHRRVRGSPVKPTLLWEKGGGEIMIRVTAEWFTYHLSPIVKAEEAVCCVPSSSCAPISITPFSHFELRSNNVADKGKERSAIIGGLPFLM